jgi:hypothetical protein
MNEDEHIYDSPNFVDFINNEWDNLSLPEKIEYIFGDTLEAIEQFKQSGYYDPVEFMEQKI